MCDTVSAGSLDFVDPAQQLESKHDLLFVFDIGYSANLTRKLSYVSDVRGVFYLIYFRQCLECKDMKLFTGTRETSRDIVSVGCRKKHKTSFHAFSIPQRLVPVMLLHMQ